MRIRVRIGRSIRSLGPPVNAPVQKGQTIGVLKVEREGLDSVEVPLVSDRDVDAGGFMALGWGTDDSSLRTLDAAILEQRFDAAGITCRYYNPAVHTAAFALPGFIGEIVDQAKQEADRRT